jgi:Tfp pilus assembly protein PilO
MEVSELIKNKLMLGVAAGVGLTALLGGAIYFENEHIAEVRTTIDGRKTEITAAHKLVAGTPDLVKQVVVERETDALVAEILPSEEDINNFVRTLRGFEEASGVRITAVKKKSLNSKEKRDFARVAYQLTFEGDVFGLLGFIDQVESDSRFMSVPAFKLAAASRDKVDADGKPLHKVTLDVETYVYEPQKASALQKIDSYDRKVDLLAAEIDERRAALQVASYDYLGARDRRDPFVDPRTPADSLLGPMMTLEEQLAAVSGLVERATELQAFWKSYHELSDFQARVEAGVTFEEQLFKLEEDVRLLQVEGTIRDLGAGRQFREDVIPAVAELRQAMGESQYGHGPGLELLKEARDVMAGHLSVGSFEQALAALTPLESGLDRAAEDEARAPLVAEIRDLAFRARTAMDFDDLELELGGVIVGAHSVALVDGKSVEEGEMVAPDLFVQSIQEDRVEFLFRGVALARLVSQ